MKIISKKKDHWIIVLEDSEYLENFVEAWARASFELAKPAGISTLTDYNSQTRWQDVRTEGREIRYSSDRNCILQMDYVAGRRCKTTILNGRKYVRVFPGDGREPEMDTMYLLARRYLTQTETLMSSMAPQTNLVQ